MSAVQEQATDSLAVSTAILPAPVPNPLLRRASAPVRFATRLSLLGAHALHGQRVVRQVFPRLDAQDKQQRIRDWSARLLQLTGIDLKVSGSPLQTPSLVAANHVSWLDVFAINAVQPVRFVSKSEAAQWPLIGKLAHGVGTLFITRERAHDVVRVIRQMTQCLQDGDHVGVFPEGTTGYGHELLPFHANLFQAACAGDCLAPVQPVLLFYADQRSGRFSRAGSYVGDETMVGSLWRMSAAPRLRIEVDYLPPLQASSRRALTQQTRDALAEHLYQRLRDNS
ncbi:MAG: lysophospholipid acyltransferase family protein [Thiomonas sp.]